MSSPGGGTAAELNLHLQLILCDGLAAHRADHTNSRAAPGSVGSPGRHPSSAYRFSGFRAQNSLVGHGKSPGSAGRSCQMPEGSDACSRHPGSQMEGDHWVTPLKLGRYECLCYRPAVQDAACGIFRPGRGAPYSHVSIHQ